MTVLRLGVVVLLRIAFKKVMLECVSHSVVLAETLLSESFPGRSPFAWSWLCHEEIVHRTCQK